MMINAIIIGLVILAIILVPLVQYFNNRKLGKEKVGRKTIDQNEWYK